MNTYPKTDKERSEFWGVKISTMARGRAMAPRWTTTTTMLAWLANAEESAACRAGKD